METVIGFFSGFVLGTGVTILTGYSIFDRRWWVICTPGVIAIALIIYLAHGS